MKPIVSHQQKSILLERHIPGASTRPAHARSPAPRKWISRQVLNSEVLIQPSMLCLAQPKQCCGPAERELFSPSASCPSNLHDTHLAVGKAPVPPTPLTTKLMLRAARLSPIINLLDTGVDARAGLTSRRTTVTSAQGHSRAAFTRSYICFRFSSCIHETGFISQPMLVRKQRLCPPGTPSPAKRVEEQLRPMPRASGL
ncbi:hypothetical protein JZ751_005945 [Albula glossodonta]|uniref:Uncharacterized protein n=1 Tax=Albula glossodonta TaxID=121402 RepID=A0A8T2PBX9_9TELE|nr:hypothetical protein JZ751_005945 [Albula glossodonta]